MIAEAAVIALAAALYLADCVVLLDRGQAILEAKWSRLALAFGSRHYQLSGRVVALLNPFTPFVPAFRTSPLFSSSVARTSGAVRAIAPLRIPCLLQFLLIFAVLPYCLYRAPGWPFVTALVAAYVNALAMLLLVWFRFKAAGIPTRPLFSLGFGWLVCLPLSANCLRSAGLSFQLAPDARRAFRFLESDQRILAREALAAQAAEAMQELDETDERYRRLAGLRRELAPEDGDGRL